MNFKGIKNLDQLIKEAGKLNDELLQNGITEIKTELKYQKEYLLKHTNINFFYGEPIYDKIIQLVDKIIEESEDFPGTVLSISSMLVELEDLAYELMQKAQEEETPEYGRELNILAENLEYIVGCKMWDVGMYLSTIKSKQDKNFKSPNIKSDLTRELGRRTLQ
jgi:hypothetical protein